MMSAQILSSIPKAIRSLRRISAGSLKNDMTFQQFRILTLVDEGMGQTQMAQNLQVSPAAISKIVDILVKKDLLVRETGEDRRCLNLKLSSKGEKLRSCIRNEVIKKLDLHLKMLTKKEQADLKRGLEVLDKFIGSLNEN